MAQTQFADEFRIMLGVNMGKWFFGATRGVPLAASVCVFLSACNLFSKKSSNSDDSNNSLKIVPDQAVGIVGGQNASDNDIVKQSTVAIIVGQSQMRCTGTLISPNVVISAAHCFVGEGLDNSNINVVFGINIQSSERRHVTSIKANAGYNPNAVLGETSPLFDTSILLLDSPAPGWTKPALLPQETEQLSPGTDFILSGFGWNYTTDLIIIRNGGGEGTLRRVNLPLTTVLDSSKQLKFVSNNKAVCSGDSGGPAYVQKGSDLVVYGITSWGYSRCESGLSIFTDTRKYRSWILENLPAGAISPENGSTTPGGGGSSATPAPAASPVASGTATPSPSTNPPMPNGTPAPRDAAILGEAQQIFAAYKAGQIPQDDEVASKTEGKRDHNITILGIIPLPVQNSQAVYRCVQIRNDQSSFGKGWGELSNSWVYYDYVRISAERNFDTFGCQWQHTSGQQLWYVQ